MASSPVSSLLTTTTAAGTLAWHPFLAAPTVPRPQKARQGRFEPPSSHHVEGSGAPLSVQPTATDTNLFCPILFPRPPAHPFSLSPHTKSLTSSSPSSGKQHCPPPRGTYARRIGYSCFRPSSSPGGGSVGQPDRRCPVRQSPSLDTTSAKKHARAIPTPVFVPDR